MCVREKTTIETGGTKQRVFYLDVARVAALLMVLISHFFQAYSGEVFYLVNGMTNLTAMSSTAFFAISGASLTLANGGTDRLDLKKFYRKRALTIFPVFYIAYAVALIFVLVHGGTLYHTFSQIPKWRFVFTLIGFDGMVGAWALPTFYLVGEWFIGGIIVLYLVFPFFRLLLNKSRWLLTAFMVAILAIGFNSTDELLPQQFIFMPFGMFVFGMIAYSKRPHPALGICGAILLVYFANFSLPMPMNTLLFSIVSGCCVIGVLFTIGSLPAYFNLEVPAKVGRCVLWVSNMSFPLILTHHFILDQAFAFYNPVEAEAGILVRVAYAALVGCLIVASAIVLKKAEKFVVAKITRSR